MMSKRTVFIVIAVLGVGLLSGGLWLYDWVLGDTLEASQPITAIPLPVEPQANPAGQPTDVVEVPSQTAGEADPAEAAEQPEIPENQAVEPTQEGQDQGEITRFRIFQDESQARFMIFEVLNGQPTDVVGVTGQTAGEIEINWNDLSQTRIGVITVNARTLVTDQDRRNQAIRNRILHTDQFEFVTLTPTGITGLSGNAVHGQTYNFQIIGDLTIRDITQPVVFDATVTVESPDRIRGLATTTILRSDYDLVIPSVPFVANVGEEVGLEIDFVLVPEP
jgi:polyisoprenoid-binding protein YceI